MNRSVKVPKRPKALSLFIQFPYLRRLCSLFHEGRILWRQTNTQGFTGVYHGFRAGKACQKIDSGILQQRPRLHKIRIGTMIFFRKRFHNIKKLWYELIHCFPLKWFYHISHIINSAESACSYM